MKKMKKMVRGYRALALIELFVCACFFANTGRSIYGTLFDIVNSTGAGILFFGSLLAYFDPRKWLLWLMTAAMLCLIAFNTVCFAWQGVFMTVGFPLIAYDTLFVVGNLHFLGKGLER